MIYPHVKLFNLCCGKYFFDVGKNQIFRVNDDEYKEIQYLCKNGYDSYYRKNKKDTRVKKWLRNGYLSSKMPYEIKHPYTSVIEDFLTTQTNNLLLQVTQMCNLRCAYCPYSGDGTTNRKHSSKRMSFEIAQKSVDFLIKNSKYSDRLYIGFYGGEPLIEFDLIKRVVQYANQETCGKPVLFSLTTNATLLSEEIIDYLVKNNFSIVISLDGPEKIHDKNRKYSGNNLGSFNNVYSALSTISTKYPDYIDNVGINAVWDFEAKYNDIASFFSSDDILSKYNCSIVPVDTTISAIKYSMNIDGYYERNLNRLFELLDYLLGKKDSIDTFETIKSALFSRPEMPNETHHAGVCFPGINRLFVDVNGDFWPCEKISENSSVSTIGNIEEGYFLEKYDSLLNLGSITEDECKKCWCNSLCTCCLNSCDTLFELSKEKKLHECEKIRRNTFTNLAEFIIVEEIKKKVHI